MCLGLYFLQRKSTKFVEVETLIVEVISVRENARLLDQSSEMASMVLKP
jgi:hypothetical protein